MTIRRRCALFFGPAPFFLNYSLQEPRETALSRDSLACLTYFNYLSSGGPSADLSFRFFAPLHRLFFGRKPRSSKRSLGMNFSINLLSLRISKKEMIRTEFLLIFYENLLFLLNANILDEFTFSIVYLEINFLWIIFPLFSFALCWFLLQATTVNDHEGNSISSIFPSKKLDYWKKDFYEMKTTISKDIWY